MSWLASSDLDEKEDEPKRQEDKAAVRQNTLSEKFTINSVPQLSRKEIDEGPDLGLEMAVG